MSVTLAVNATTCVKVPLRIIIHAKKLRLFCLWPFTLHYQSQTNSWADTTSFSSWFHSRFFPHVRRETNAKFLLLMDNCVSHSGLRDPRGKVRMGFFPPRVTSVRQPLDQGIIANLKRRYLQDILRILHEGTDK